MHGQGNIALAYLYNIQKYGVMLVLRLLCNAEDEIYGQTQCARTPSRGKQKFSERAIFPLKQE